MLLTHSIGMGLTRRFNAGESLKFIMIVAPPVSGCDHTSALRENIFCPHVDLTKFVRRKVGNENIILETEGLEAMKYLLLIYDKEQEWGALGEAGQQAIF